MSASVLSESLKRLERSNIITRTVKIDTMPIRVHNSLTEKREDFSSVFNTLKGWGLKWGELYF